MQGIRAADIRPIALRGGVMMVQLTGEEPAGDWPDTLTLMLSDGRAAAGVVGWVAQSPLPRVRHWTDDLRGLAVFSSADVPRRDGLPAGVPYVFVRVPRDWAGTMALGQQTLRPVWVDVPPAVEGGAPLERANAPHRPDPDSPFEHWRWVLLADEQGMAPPAFESPNEPAMMLAEHLSGLWRVGLARLEQIDAKAHATVRHLLTRMATDRGMPFAAWVADPGATGGLVQELTRPGQSDEVIAEFVQYWIDEHDTTLVWPEADYDATLRLAVLSAGDARRQEMSLRFPGLSRSPMQFTIEPNVLMRVQASKPVLTGESAARAFGGAAAQRETVLVNLPGREMELPLRPRRYEAVPPGVFLSELGAPLTLAEVQTLQRVGVPADQATLVSVRKLQGRWEVFVDCRRPADARPTAEGERAEALPDRATSFDALRGREAITLLIGPEDIEDGPSAILTVPETGWHRVYFGVQAGSLQVHTQSHADRWHARIVLPDDWLPHPELGPALLGFIRTHSDSQAIETGPNATVPWRIEPGRVAIDLSEWDGDAGP